MSTDFLPRTDTELLIWSNNFLKTVEANQNTLAFKVEQVSALKDSTNSVKEVLDEQAAIQAASKQVTQKKNNIIDNHVKLVREQVRQIQANPDITEGELAAYGLNVRDKKPTPTGAPISRPVVTVDTSQRLRHTLSWRDEATSTSAAKPAGVMGCEVWVKIGGDAPVDEEECRFLALDTATPYTSEYKGGEAGKIAHYLLRWVSKGGDKGPWSAVISATIVA